MAARPGRLTGTHRRPAGRRCRRPRGLRCPGLRLAAGDTMLRTTPGRTTGLDVDRLRPALGGGRRRRDRPRTPGGPTGRPETARPSRSWTRTAPRPPARGRGRRTVLARPRPEPQRGLAATADGEDLGPRRWSTATRTGGGPRRHAPIHLEWIPQRVVTALLGASLAFVLAAICWPWLASGPRGATTSGTPRGAARPPRCPVLQLPRASPWSGCSAMRGPTPSRFALARHGRRRRGWAVGRHRARAGRVCWRWPPW